MAPFIRCQRIVKAYNVSGHELVALRGIDFQMEKGEMVAIVGPSGAGKSSLLNLLGGLDRPTAGQLEVDGRNLLEMKARALANYRLRHVGFLWQAISQNLLPHRSALGNVTLPMMMAGIPPWKRCRRAMELLDAVGIADKARQNPTALSGGQQQRVAVAVALANQPSLLLADEPTGALDRQSAAQVMKLLEDLRREFNLTVLLVTHDMELAGYSDRILTLRDGALGQDLIHPDDEGLRFDETGRIKLPDEVVHQFHESERITVEIRPEGILLRSEEEEEDNTSALLEEMMPQDAPPERRGLLGRLRRKRKA
jgi:putative ABC transport system ATP-binding protein